MSKFYALFLGIFCSLSAWGQTVLSTGDVAIVYVNPSGTDRFSFAILRDIASGTVINITDNGFASSAAGRVGEGFVIFTAVKSYPKGTVFTWTNGAANSSEFTSGSGGAANNPTNFALNATGDQLFVFQGSIANWASQSGITLLFGINTGNSGFISTGSASATASYQPASLISSTTVLQFAQPNGYFANGSSAASNVNIPANTTQAQLLALIADPSKWYKDAGEITTPATYSGALPVTYLNFQAKSAGAKMVMVSWETVSEVNNARFEVERSSDAITYATLGQVAGRGTTTSRQQYAFTDEAPDTGWNYYRLRQTDTDGTTSLSRPVAVLSENALDAGLVLAPNPAGAQVRLLLTNGEKAEQATVVSLSGQRVLLAMPSPETLDVASLPSALYLLEVQTSTGRVLRQRLVKN